MSSSQLTFTLRTSTNVKTVHLLGSWDNYEGQLPLSKDSAKAGSWRGVFRFQSATLKPGQRYWYYYIMDGFHVSHDPAKPSTKEPTTGRQLNILDAPSATSSSGRAREVPVGRSVSTCDIISPKPTKAYASRNIREADYTVSPIDELADQLEQASLHSKYSGSPASSIDTDSSDSSGRSGISSPSSLSSLSDRSGSSCRCNRYGITRKGDRVKMDCGGERCGYGSESSSGCSSESEEDQRPAARSNKAPAARGGKPRAAVTSSRRR